MVKKNAVFRAGKLKRLRRTNDELEQLDQQILGVLAEDHPQSVRHVFCRMIKPCLSQPVPKPDQGYRHVQDRCAKLRPLGRMPYSWITDMSRRDYFTYSALEAVKITEESERNLLAQMAGMFDGGV